jgi:hypothetical protein
MTKAEALSITQLMRELEKELQRFANEKTRESILAQIKANEPMYAKAQKVLARYYK